MENTYTVDLAPATWAYSFLTLPKNTDLEGCPTDDASLVVSRSEGPLVITSYACGSVYAWQPNVAARVWEVRLRHHGFACGFPLDGEEQG